MAYLGKTPSQAVRSRYYFTATGGETSLSGADDNSNVLAFSDGNYVDVSLNGVALVAGTDYNTTTANTIGGLTALVASDVIEVIVYDTFSVFSGNVNSNFSVGGDLSVTGTSTFGNNIDVTGTITSDGLTVDGNSTFGDGTFSIVDQGTNGLQINHFSNNNTTIDNADSGDIFIRSGGTNFLKIDNLGDIAFYDSTGVTQGLFWDASTQRLGLGTTGPSKSLHIYNGASGCTPYGTGILIEDNTETYLEFNTPAGMLPGIAWATPTQQTSGTILYHTTDRYMKFATAGAERLRIDSSGNVGIGTSSPSDKLNVDGSLFIGDEATTGSAGAFRIIPFAGDAYVQWGANRSAGSVSDLIFTGMQGSPEHLRIDSNGALQIGGTTNAGFIDFDSTSLQLNTQRNPNTGVFVNTGKAHASIALRGDNGSSEIRFATASANNTAASERMRLDADGNLLVGHTGTNIYADTSGSGITANQNGRLDVKRADILATFNRTVTDGEILQFRKDGTTVGNIGTNGGKAYISGPAAGGIRFDQYDATNGAPLPCTSTGADADNLHDFGVSFARWDDIYATNGTIQTSDQNEKQQIASLTDAEIAAAKAISQLFKTFKWNDKVEAKGDAARTHTGVIAQDVEAAMTAAGLDAGDYAFFISTDWYVDADGNKVEADAEGAIAKNRKGIRYPELLSFVGAATEQRLANIETRLAALENA